MGTVHWRGIRRPGRAGVSLMEALVTIALIGACLGVMATLFSNAAHLLQQQSDSDEGVQALNVAIQAIAQEVRQSVTGSVKPSGYASSTLSMLRVAGCAAPVAGTLATVRLSLNPESRELVRECGGVRSVLARRIALFQAAAYDPDGHVEVTVQTEPGIGLTRQTTFLLQPSLVRLPSSMTTVQP